MSTVPGMLRGGGSLVLSRAYPADSHVVNLRPQGLLRARRVILVPDNIDLRDFRRLRTWLRWRSGESGDLAQPVDR